MDIAIEIEADDVPPLLAQAQAEQIEVECFEPKRFGGVAELAVVVVPIAAGTLPWITKIILARIAANRHVKVKVNGIEIQGLSASNTQKLLAELLADQANASPPAPPSSAPGVSPPGKRKAKLGPGVD